MSNPESTLRIVIHAPTPTALARARSNASNIHREAPDAQVRIVVNALAVTALLDSPHEETDALTYICPNTLKGLQRNAPAPLQVLPEGAALSLARLQQAGWYYLRA
jgi:uncharacterized protein